MQKTRRHRWWTYLTKTKEAFIKKCSNEQFVNSLETKLKIGNIGKEVEDIKNNQMKNLEVKNKITEIKNNSLHTPNSRKEMTEERVSVPDGGSIEIIQSEKHREKKIAKPNQTKTKQEQQKG